MKKVSFCLFFGSALVLGLLSGSCTNSNSNSGSKTSSQDSGKGKTDSDSKPATEGKILKGNEVEIHTVGNTMKYDATEIHMPANTDATITLVNEGTDLSMVHDIVICKAEDVEEVYTKGIESGMAGGYLPKDMSKVIAASGLAQPGAKTVLKFKTPAKGEYVFMCTFPGHYKMMQGKFIAE